MILEEVIILKFIKWHLFITSFLPLWVSIIVYDIAKIWESTCVVLSKGAPFWCNVKNVALHNWLSIVVILSSALISIVSIIALSKYLRKMENRTDNPIAKISKVQRERRISSEFLIAYILPMLVFDFSSFLGVILFILYFSFLSIISIRNNNIYTNIFLELKKYKMYTADVEIKVMGQDVIYEKSIMISKTDLSNTINQEINYMDFENFVYIHLNKGDK